MTIPYYAATSGVKARGEIQNILRHFDCESVGFLDEFKTKTVVLAFSYRGHNVSMRASAQGWANLYLRENPYHSGRHGSERDYNERWLNQGMIAVNSILRDWIKGQVTAIETGVFSFEEIFMPHMLLPDGTRLIEHMGRLLEIEGPQG